VSKELKITQGILNTILDNYEKKFVKRVKKEIKKLNKRSGRARYSSIAGNGVCAFFDDESVIDDNELSERLKKLDEEWSTMAKEYNFYMSWNISSKT